MSGPPPPEAGPEAPAWADPSPGRPLPFWASLREDVAAHIPPARRPGGRLGWVGAALPVVLRSAGLHATACYRLAHTLRGTPGGPPGAALAALVFWAVRHAYGCSLAPTARLFGGLSLPHPQGIVVGPGAVVGPRAWVFQNVTIGGAPGRDGFPTVGADARIFAGAVLAGPIVLGDEVIVGANCVVARDVPGRSLVRPPEPVVSPTPDRLRHGGS